MDPRAVVLSTRPPFPVLSPPCLLPGVGVAGHDGHSPTLLSLVAGVHARQGYRRNARPMSGHSHHPAADVIAIPECSALLDSLPLTE